MFEESVYLERRKKLITKVKKGMILFLGNHESPMNYDDNTYHFRQDSSFLYFFGLDIPGIAAVIDAETGYECIFGDDVDVDDIIWMGPQESIAVKAGRAGVKNTLKCRQLGDVLVAALRKGQKIHFLPQYREKNKMLLRELLGLTPEKQDFYHSVELIRAIVDLRSIKELCEVEEIEKACAAGYQMHVKAMQMARPGVSEQLIAGTIEGIAAASGGTVPFPVILSQNGETLHNHDHSQILQKGRLMITDAGAQTMMKYCSDYTRTIPVGGKFSPRQKDIYAIVLAANKKAAELIKPGVTYLSVHLAVSEVIASGLRDLGLMRGDPQEAVANGAHALFFPHGLGHMLGLDVHDMEAIGQIYVGYDDETRPSEQFGTRSLRLGRRLQPGFVITNEPGIYFIPALIHKWKTEKVNAEFIHFSKLEEYEHFGGIRIEDDILVTRDGNRLLGKKVPVEPGEIERIVSSE